MEEVKRILGWLQPAFAPGVVLSQTSVASVEGTGLSVSLFIKGPDGAVLAHCTFELYWEPGRGPSGQIMWLEVMPPGQGRMLGRFLMAVIDAVTSSVSGLTKMTLANFTDDPERAAKGLYWTFDRERGEAGEEGEMVQHHHSGTVRMARGRMRRLGEQLAANALPPPWPWAADAGAVLRRAAGYLGQTARGGGKARGRRRRRRRRATARPRGRSRRGKSRRRARRTSKRKSMRRRSR